jgi:hypothetical protein
MTEISHKLLGMEENHPLHSYEFADYSELWLARSYQNSDLGKVALVAAQGPDVDPTFWFLVDTAPKWIPCGGYDPNKFPKYCTAVGGPKQRRPWDTNNLSPSYDSFFLWHCTGYTNEVTLTVFAHDSVTGGAGFVGLEAHGPNVVPMGLVYMPQHFALRFNDPNGGGGDLVPVQFDVRVVFQEDTVGTIFDETFLYTRIFGQA